MAFLYHIKADGEAECWPVHDKPVVAGRGEFADAYVEDDALSRSHFLIIREKEEFFVIDLHSSNGTWVRGDLVSALRLESNEIILAGDSLFYFSPMPVTADALPRAVPLPQRPKVGLSQLSAA